MSPLSSSVSHGGTFNDEHLSIASSVVGTLPESKLTGAAGLALGGGDEAFFATGKGGAADLVFSLERREGASALLAGDDGGLAFERPVGLGAPPLFPDSCLYTRGLEVSNSSITLSTAL